MWVFQRVCAGDQNPPGPSQKSAWDGFMPASKSRHGPASGAHGLHGQDHSVNTQPQGWCTYKMKAMSQDPFARSQ